MSDNFPVTFSPSQKCCFCERKTTWGVAEYANEHQAAFAVDPACWEHGYIEAARVRQPTADEVRWERESIVRFIIGYHGDVGTASVIAECEPEDVPGFELPPKEETNGFGFYAWQVWYEADGKRSYGYVVFDIDAFVFEWYGPAGRQEEEEVQ